MEEDAPSEVEYVSEQLDVNGAALEAFSDVFARFQLPPDETAVSNILCVLVFKVLLSLCTTRRRRLNLPKVKSSIPTMT